MAHDVVHKIVLGPIVSKEIGKWQGTANVFAERELGPDSGSQALSWNNAFQLKYRMHELFEPGLVVESAGREIENERPDAVGNSHEGDERLSSQPLPDAPQQVVGEEAA